MHCPRLDRNYEIKEIQKSLCEEIQHKHVLLEDQSGGQTETVVFF